MIIQCKNCELSIKIPKYRIGIAKFCSKECSNAFKRVEKACKECHKKYVVKKSRSKTSTYCSKKCQSSWGKVNLTGKNASNYKNGNYTEKIRTKCRVCNKEFFQLKAHLEKGFGEICSKECRSKNQSDWQIANSPTRKEKIIVVCEWCKSQKFLIPSFAKPFRFCSMKCRNDWQSKVRMRGENHPLWNGGESEIRSRISVSREYKEWRKAVFTRDKFTCKKCGDKRGGNLNAHHIKPLATNPEFAFVVSNGLTLCEDCHIQLHQKMPQIRGKGKLKEFFGEVGILE